MDQQLVNYGPGRLGCMFSFTQPTITELWLFKVEGISFIKKITNRFSRDNACVYIYVDILHPQITIHTANKQTYHPWSKSIPCFATPNGVPYGYGTDTNSHTAHAENQENPLHRYIEQQHY